MKYLFLGLLFILPTLSFALTINKVVFDDGIKVVTLKNAKKLITVQYNSSEVQRYYDLWSNGEMSVDALEENIIRLSVEKRLKTRIIGHTDDSDCTLDCLDKGLFTPLITLDGIPPTEIETSVTEIQVVGEGRMTRAILSISNDSVSIKLYVTDHILVNAENEFNDYIAKLISPTGAVHSITVTDIISID